MDALSTLPLGVGECHGALVWTSRLIAAACAGGTMVLHFREGSSMPMSCFRSVVCSLALLGLNVGAAPKEPVVSQAMSFPVDADFALGSFVLGINAQERLDGVVRSLQGADLEVLVVEAFAGSNDTPLVALERARSVRAFFVLHGVAPERVYIDSGSDDLRPHRFVLDVVAARKR